MSEVSIKRAENGYLVTHLATGASYVFENFYEEGIPTEEANVANFAIAMEKAAEVFGFNTKSKYGVFFGLNEDFKDETKTEILKN